VDGGSGEPVVTVQRDLVPHVKKFPHMYRPARERPDRARRLGAVELVCVVVVLAAFLALAIWIVAHAGGGVLNQG
jgi:hypothetical protein